MKMTHEFLKRYVAKVEVMEELKLGDLYDYFEDGKYNNNPYIRVDEENRIIIPKGTVGLLSVCMSTYHLELKVGNNVFDVAHDDDETMNKMFKFINTEGINEFFIYN